jgi:hypothetical protein
LTDPPPSSINSIFGASSPTNSATPSTEPLPGSLRISPCLSLRPSHNQPLRGNEPSLSMSADAFPVNDGPSNFTGSCWSNFSSRHPTGGPFFSAARRTISQVGPAPEMFSPLRRASPTSCAGWLPRTSFSPTTPYPLTSPLLWPDHASRSSARAIPLGSPRAEIIPTPSPPPFAPSAPASINVANPLSCASSRSLQTWSCRTC